MPGVRDRGSQIPSGTKRPAARIKVQRVSSKKWAFVKIFMPDGHVVLNNVMFAPLVLNGKTVGIMGLANKSKDFHLFQLQEDS